MCIALLSGYSAAAELHYLKIHFCTSYNKCYKIQIYERIKIILTLIM